MSFFSLFKKPAVSVELLKTSDVNGFADMVAVELKCAVTQAISSAIEVVEGKYLKSVLLESVFPLEALILTPQDEKTTQSLDEFIREHEAIQPHFRRQFFQKILQSEYKSKRGATIVLPAGFEPTIHHSSKSFENSSSDEEFNITLRGRKVLFSATAILGSPITRSHFFESQKAVGIKQQVPNKKALQASSINLQWFDRDGVHNDAVSAPIQIGRELDVRCVEYGVSPIVINATYISRRQLHIFYVMDQLYAFVPHEASLTCLKNGLKMKPGQMYKVNLEEQEVFQFGIAPESSDAFRHGGNTADYPLLEMAISEPEFIGSISDGTPKPKAR